MYRKIVVYMRRIILILTIITIVVAGYSQDTIITSKNIHVGEISEIKNKYFIIKKSEKVGLLNPVYEDVYSWIPYKKVEKLITSKSAANEAFKCYQSGEQYVINNSSVIKIDETAKDLYSDEYISTLSVFNKFNSQRKGGKVAMITGGAITVLGGVLSGVGVYKAIPELVISGSVIAGAGGVSFFVGLFCWIDGQDKMFNAKNELNIIKLKRSIISGDICPNGAKISLSF